jgi:hypothetical protein
VTPDPEEIPIIGSLYRSGRDRGYDTLILCGPLLIAVIALLGRSPLTTVLAAGYVSVFALYTLWKSIR